MYKFWDGKTKTVTDLSTIVPIRLYQNAACVMMSLELFLAKRFLQGIYNGDAACNFTKENEVRSNLPPTKIFCAWADEKK